MRYAIVIDPDTGEMAVSSGDTEGFVSREEAQRFLDNYDFGPMAYVDTFSNAMELWKLNNERPGRTGRTYVEIRVPLHLED